MRKTCQTALLCTTNKVEAGDRACIYFEPQTLCCRFNDSNTMFGCSFQWRNRCYNGKAECYCAHLTIFQCTVVGQSSKLV